MEENVYNPKARETGVFEQRMSLTSFKAKSVEMLVKAEMSPLPEYGAHYAAIAQGYAILELARVTAAQKLRK